MKTLFIMRKRERSPEANTVTILERLLGSGGFNVALLGKDGVVYRFAAVKRDKQPTVVSMLMRSSAILKLTTKYKDILGPSTLVEVKEGHWTGLYEYKDQRVVIEHILNEFPERDGYEYYLSKLEYLSGGTLEKNTQPTVGGTFALGK